MPNLLLIDYFRKFWYCQHPGFYAVKKNKSGYLQIGMQIKVVSRIKSAVAASSEKRCDTMVVLVFDEMTIKGKCYD